MTRDNHENPGNIDSFLIETCRLSQVRNYEGRTGNYMRNYIGMRQLV